MSFKGVKGSKFQILQCNIYLFAQPGNKLYIDSAVSIREKKRFVRPPAEKQSFRDARTRIMTLNHRGKTFSVPLDAMSSEFPPIFFPTFCYTACSALFFSFFIFFSFLLSLQPRSCVSFRSVFRRREGKRATRGRFAQRLEAVGRFFARKIMADSLDIC